jgi:hypothetical protein
MQCRQPRPHPVRLQPSRQTAGSMPQPGAHISPDFCAFAGRKVTTGPRAKRLGAGAAGWGNDRITFARNPPASTARPLAHREAIAEDHPHRVLGKCIRAAVTAGAVADSVQRLRDLATSLAALLRPPPRDGSQVVKAAASSPKWLTGRCRSTASDVSTRIRQTVSTAPPFV